MMDLDPKGLEAVIRQIGTSDMTHYDSQSAKARADAARYIRAYLAATTEPQPTTMATTSVARCHWPYCTCYTLQGQNSCAAEVHP